MDDLISRQAALDGKIVIQRTNGVEIYSDEAVPVEYLKNLPSRQPEPSTNCSEIPNSSDTISRQAVIDALHTWFRDGFDEDKWWNSTHVLAAIEGLPSVQQEHKWETCFECPLSHGCPKIKGCTNEQAIEYASQIPNDCPLSAQPNLQSTCNQLATDCISRQQAIDIVVFECGKWTGLAKEISKQLKQLPPAQPEPQWIPVSERLPEESGYYIATTHDGVGRRTTFVKYQKKAKSWELTGARSYWRVIAWMPLPEAYTK